MIYKYKCKICKEVFYSQDKREHTETHQDRAYWEFETQYYYMTVVE
jgi:hypothetical protein